MTETILSAIISAAAAIAVCLLNSRFQNKRTQAKQAETVELIEYKIDELRHQVEKHNDVIGRTYKLEGQMQEVQHEIRDLKGIR